MCKAGAVVLLCLAACSSRKREDKQSPIVREEEMDVAKPAEQKPAEIAAEPTPPQQDDSAAAEPAPEPKPECLDQGTILSFDPGKLKACFDTNGDEQADRCVTWRRDGKVANIDSVFAVEDSSAEEVTPPVEFRSDTDNNDDERITLDYSSVDICPYDRACMKLMPRLHDKVEDGGEIQHVLTDPDYKRAVMVIKHGAGESGAFEVWDLATGRQRGRFPMKRLVTDEYYDFNAYLGSGVVIGVAESSSEMKALGTIFGLDGGVRGELAQGSRNLDLEKTFTHAGVFGVVDVGENDDKPYILYLHSLANGAAIGKFTIKRDDDGDDDLTFHTMKGGFVGVTQWGEQVRIDMIDLKSRTNRVLFAPGC